MSDANLAAAARKAGLIPHIRRSQQARSQVITAKTRDNVHATALKAIIYAKYIVSRSAVAVEGDGTDVAG